jgi:beta-glucosidase
VNYYMPTRVSALPGAPLPFQLEPIEGYPVTAFGWPVIPAGLTELLVQLRDRYGSQLPPLHVTENGCSVDGQPGDERCLDDQFRVGYLDGHIRAIADAIAAGVDVRSYLVWSLMDNFEWSEGYRQRFGLVHVDFGTQLRTRRASFGWFRDVIAAQRAAGLAGLAGHEQAD